MNLLDAIKNLSESITIANETLQACVRELQAHEQREMELAKNREEMSRVDRVPEPDKSAVVSSYRSILDLPELTGGSCEVQLDRAFKKIRALEFRVKKYEHNLQWVKFADEYPSEKGFYLIKNDQINNNIFNFEALNQQRDHWKDNYTAWLKIPDFKDGK